MTKLKQLLRDQKGAAAIEYGLLVALISLAMAGAARDVGQQLANTFETVDAAMSQRPHVVIRRP
ncbi:MAG TPA: Flp family type IVb pilin [Allosphingosinicella sp.]|jgi:pilus assembly protein Flp/PilA